MLPALLITLTLLTLTATAWAAHGIGYKFLEGQAPAGGTALVMPHGTLITRDIQCGDLTNNPHDLNCDIGAGTQGHPGNISLNYDLGRCTVIYNGNKQRLARFCPEGIALYAPVRFKHGARGLRR